MGSYGLHGRRVRFGDWRWPQFSFGVRGHYVSSDSSRVSFTSGIIWMRPFLEDNTGVFCDMGPCPSDWRKEHFLKIPISADYAIVNWRRKNYKLTTGLGVAPMLLIWGKHKDYLYEDGQSGFGIIDRYGLFDKPKYSETKPVTLNYTLSLINEFYAGRHLWVLGIRTEFFSRMSQPIVYDEWSLSVGLLF